MKIDKKTLLEFLEVSNLKNLIKCSIDFAPDGVKIKTADEPKQTMVDSILKAEAFEQYEAIGKIAVHSLSDFIKCMKKMNKEVEFSIEGNLLEAKGKNKTLHLELLDSKFIEENNDIVEKLDNIKQETSCDVNVSDIKEFIKDASMSKDSIIEITTVNDGLTLKNTGKYQFTHNIDSIGSQEGVKAKYGQPFVDVFNQLPDSKSTLYLSNDYPMKVEVKTDSSIYKFFIAPRQ